MRTSADGKNVLRLKYEQGKLVSKGDDLKSLPYLHKVTQLVATGKDPLAERALKLLVHEADLEYQQTPLPEVLEDFRERFMMPIHIERSLYDVPRIIDHPVTMDEQKIQVFLGLHQIVEEQGLTFDYRFHSFWLTTPKMAAEWKDPTGVSDLKPAEGSALAKALPEPLKADLAVPLRDLPKVVQDEYGFELDISGLGDGGWTRPDKVPSRPGLIRPLLRDTLFMALYANKCRCREEGGKLILSRITP